MQEIKANIAAAEQRAGREPGSVKLLAVSAASERAEAVENEEKEPTPEAE